MCLAVPGKILTVEDSDPPEMGRVAKVDFQGTKIEVSLAMTPDASCGDWVLVHAGFALNVLDEQEARETWQYLREAGVELGLGESD
ncbi:MAG: HypC/HybG/HupF family hydrogenase formation chaperone [Sedimentisphaerales bacterium]|nr:HypC/HybG/HupF family hydrogenase formation chaperone [Sedimentisphaerales bacterium]